MEDLTSLIERVRAGKREAYGDLVRRFQDMAVGYSYALLGDQHLAEDAAQEAFVFAYLELEKLQEPAAFLGWFRCHRPHAVRTLAASGRAADGGIGCRQPDCFRCAESNAGTRGQ